MSAPLTTLTRVTGLLLDLRNSTVPLTGPLVTVLQHSNRAKKRKLPWRTSRADFPRTTRSASRAGPAIAAGCQQNASRERKWKRRRTHAAPMTCTHYACIYRAPVLETRATTTPSVPGRRHHAGADAFC